MLSPRRAFGDASSSRANAPNATLQKAEKPLGTPRSLEQNLEAKESRGSVAVGSSCVAVLNEAERREGRSAAAQRDALEIDDFFTTTSAISGTTSAR